MKWIPVVVATLALACGMCGAEAAPSKNVWMMPPAGPDGKCLRELFRKPQQWKETRSRVSVLGYADHMLNRQYKDDELRPWFAAMNGWGLKLGLEVGAVKPWGETGKAVFEAEQPMWERFRSLGAKIHAFAMDEPLCCVRFDLKKPDSYAVEETADFIARVRQAYPDILIGDVEPYPSIPLKDLIAWIDALQAKLAAKGVRGLDFFRLDVDWVHFVVGKPGGWTEVRQLEEACRARKIPFSLIYWAADYGQLQSMGLADDSTWYVGVMRQADDYALVGGSPDEYVVESWVGAPSKAVPEGGDWTFCRSVRDFCRKYAARSK